MNITVAGSGLMGNALAQVFASKHTVTVLAGRKPIEEYRAQVVNNLDIMIEAGATTKEYKEEILSKITYTKDKAEAYTNADFIIESAPEIMELKQELFAEAEKYCREDTIFATNTSVMSVTEIAKLCKHKDRGLGAHFWNPGHLIPLVEVVKTEETDQKYIDITMNLLEEVGKKPILCKKDVPGFVANRLQHALWREAFYMVENGIADAKTVDDACKYGPGLRWPILGPMENSDMVSIQLSYNIHDYILQHLADNHEPSKCLKEMLDQGDNGFATGKGWQEWTKEEMDESGKKLRSYLIENLK